MKACNTSVHEGTEFTPHELVFGRAARVLTSSILPDDNDNESNPEYAMTLFKRIFDTQATARENLKRAKMRSKRYYDQKTNQQIFKEDKYVYLLKESSQDKFNDKLRICKTQPTEPSLLKNLRHLQLHICISLPYEVDTGYICNTTHACTRTLSLERDYFEL
jgi:hypothetical protein